MKSQNSLSVYRSFVATTSFFATGLAASRLFHAGDPTYTSTPVALENVTANFGTTAQVLLGLQLIPMAISYFLYKVSLTSDTIPMYLLADCATHQRWREAKDIREATHRLRIQLCSSILTRSRPFQPHRHAQSYILLAHSNRGVRSITGIPSSGSFAAGHFFGRKVHSYEESACSWLSMVNTQER